MGTVVQAEGLGSPASRLPEIGWTTIGATKSRAANVVLSFRRLTDPSFVVGTESVSSAQGFAELHLSKLREYRDSCLVIAAFGEGTFQPIYTQMAGAVGAFVVAVDEAFGKASGAQIAELELLATSLNEPLHNLESVLDMARSRLFPETRAQEDQPSPARRMISAIFRFRMTRSPVEVVPDGEKTT